MNQLARKLLGDGAYTSARRNISTWWTVEVNTPDNRVWRSEEAPGLRSCYSRLAIGLRGRLLEIEREDECEGRAASAGELALQESTARLAARIVPEEES